MAVKKTLVGVAYYGTETGRWSGKKPHLSSKLSKKATKLAEELNTQADLDFDWLERNAYTDAPMPNRRAAIEHTRQKNARTDCS